LIAVDTSIVIAAFASWHQSHALAAAVVAEEPSLPAPCALEAYAVMTRMPPPHRVEVEVAREFLVRAFPAEVLVLPPARSMRLIDELAGMGISGGASYDAVIAMTASHHGCQLATLDARARATYERVGVAVRYLR
jgi:predicted nucleic acid-binding protein